MSKTLVIVICFALLALINTSSATMQTFETDFGKAHINVPDGYVIKDPDSKNAIQFVRQGSEKPIISIALDSIEIFGPNLNKYAASHFGEGKPYTDEETNDGHKMQFYAYNSYGDISDYSGLIDFTEDKEAIVNVFGSSETIAYGQILATFNEYGFLNIAKSFGFE